MEGRPPKKLRIFHGLVNYGSQAGLLAKGLREEGYSALSVTYPDPYKRTIDIELLYGGNVIQRVFKHTWNWLRRFYWFFRFDIFHFYYGTTLLPFHADLPLYRLLGKKVIFHYLGKDVAMHEESVKKYSITNMSYPIEQEAHYRKIDKRKRRRLSRETRYADLQFVCSPIYSEFVPGSVFLPLAIDLDKYRYIEKLPGDKLVVMHAPTSRENKGTSYIEAAVERLMTEGYNISLSLCTGMTNDELREKYSECDIFVDQLLSGGYGMAAIEAMATGRPAICFLRDDLFSDHSFPTEIPIIRADIKNIYDVLKRMINDKKELSSIGLKSRKFIEEYHDIRKIVFRFISYYETIWLANDR